jgi:hypothetical protein
LIFLKKVDFVCTTWTTSVQSGTIPGPGDEAPHLASCVRIGVLLNGLAGLLGIPMVAGQVSGQSGRQCRRILSR